MGPIDTILQNWFDKYAYQNDQLAENTMLFCGTIQGKYDDYSECRTLNQFIHIVDNDDLIEIDQQKIRICLRWLMNKSNGKI